MSPTLSATPGLVPWGMGMLAQILAAVHGMEIL